MALLLESDNKSSPLQSKLFLADFEQEAHVYRVGLLVQPLSLAIFLYINFLSHSKFTLVLDPCDENMRV